MWNLLYQRLDRLVHLACIAVRLDIDYVLVILDEQFKCQTFRSCQAINGNANANVS